MTTQRQTSTAVNARSILLPYTLVLTTAMVIIQAVIALTGGEVTLLAQALTALVAIGIVVWFWRNYRSLTHVRFGVVVAHAVAFTAVTTSYNAHVVLRTVALGSGAGGFEAAAQNLLATPWFAVTLVTSAAWGLGLLLHLTGSVLGRGWED